MSKERGVKILKIFTVLSFVLMVTVNALANILPINGITTGGVSDSYPNLFAPAGVTFAIWGIIYILLAGFVIYQLGLFKGSDTNAIVKLIDGYFIISSLTNATWIFSWQYKVIPLSMILMIVILVCLIKINDKINSIELTSKEKLFVKLPFSVYFGWITVATIANATTLLVSLGWNGWGLSEQIWTIIILLVGLVIGMATTLKNKDIPYGIVIFWAYLGILIKHVSSSGFAGEYYGIITTLIISLVIIFICLLYVSKKRKKYNLI
ncbi:lantibiotic ABC transporter permease [Clostridium estertheticum]|uniref:Lantibiotic ABC transporter permease n=1 Tax=Clostridium estertheticum subsp. estertheticum TaxID=1552 RepID=A0A1J0GFV6_9CLOT|nr:lantibiotic ABC transporter permease [Clostridium estertheticum]APC40187.1 lantibiotic ABC transporter permease [Clostridium estertheticum subsp. estertheticum]MBZ9618021.1 tryptophan-rich sensory protein [Clostridium estertheticum subsp. laramiense]WAG73680.1 tryptophan-rich sensory protein [Clostridium estertheticum]